MIFTWIIGLICVATMTIDSFCYVTPLVAIRNGGVCAIVSIESLVLSIYLHFNHECIRNLIGNINFILSINESYDEKLLKRCMRDALEPHKQRLIMYTVMAISSVIDVYTAMPVIRIFDETDGYSYEDIKIAAYLQIGTPFNVSVFVGGVIVETVGCGLFILKNSGIDVYINYTITLLTSEYRFFNQRISNALKKNNEFVVNALHKCEQ